MSDTDKTTPRPWRHGNAHDDPYRGEDIFIGADGTVVATTGDIGGFIKAGDADLALTAVNVCPQVEELVRMIESYHERILKNPTDVDSYPTAADIFAKNREVKAALKG